MTRNPLVAVAIALAFLPERLRASKEMYSIDPTRTHCIQAPLGLRVGRKSRKP